MENSTSSERGLFDGTASYTAVIDSALPVDEAFSYMADVRNFAEWDPGVSSSEQVEGEGPDLGAAYELKASGLTLRYEVRKYDPEEATMRLVSDGHPLLTSIDDIVVDPGPSRGSRITYRARLELPRWLFLLTPALRFGFDRVGDRAADGMAKALNGAIARTTA